MCFRFDDNIIDGVPPPDHLQVSSNDSDEGHHNDDEDINCDRFSSKNLTFSSYFYKAALNHDGGIITKIIFITDSFLHSSDLILVMDSSSQHFFQKLLSRNLHVFKQNKYISYE